MQTQLADWERQLGDAYAQQIELYTSLDEQAGDLGERSYSGPEMDARMVAINQLMTRIAELDSVVQPIRDQWQRAGVKAGPSLAATLKQLEQLIVRVMQHLERAEAIAVSAKGQLASRRTNESQRQRMVAAYDANRST